MVVKVFKGFRFDPAVYDDFRKFASKDGYTVTSALERFMICCVSDGVLVFPKRVTVDFDVEARVLVDWLSKGKRLYRDADGGEVNISGRLVWLLGKVLDANLRLRMEEVLKRAVCEKE